MSVPTRATATELGQAAPPLTSIRACSVWFRRVRGRTEGCNSRVSWRSKARAPGTRNSPWGERSPSRWDRSPSPRSRSPAQRSARARGSRTPRAKGTRSGSSECVAPVRARATRGRRAPNGTRRRSQRGLPARAVPSTPRALGSRGAWLLAPYSDQPSTRGDGDARQRRDRSQRERRLGACNVPAQVSARDPRADLGGEPRRPRDRRL